jgi:hypothetical protein
MNRFDEDLGLLTIANLTSLLGQNRQTVMRLIESGSIPVAYVDGETGERFFTRAVLAAQQRRTGELHAEEMRAAQLAAAARVADETVKQPKQRAEPAADAPAEPAVDGEPVEVPVVTGALAGTDAMSSLDRALNAAIARRNAEEFRSPTYRATPPKRPRPAHT